MGQKEACSGERELSLPSSGQLQKCRKGCGARTAGEEPRQPRPSGEDIGTCRKEGKVWEDSKLGSPEHGEKGSLEQPGEQEDCMELVRGHAGSPAPPTRCPVPQGAGQVQVPVWGVWQSLPAALPPQEASFCPCWPQTLPLHGVWQELQLGGELQSPPVGPPGRAAFRVPPVQQGVAHEGRPAGAPGPAQRAAPLLRALRQVLHPGHQAAAPPEVPPG